MLVEYRRRQYDVPDWAKFIATDSDGRVYVYSREPRFSCAFWILEGGRVNYVGTRQPLKAPGNSLERIAAHLIPRYRLTSLADIKVGDVITTRAKWHISGWCPPITVEEIGFVFISGYDRHGVPRDIGNSKRIFKQVKP